MTELNERLNKAGNLRPRGKREKGNVINPNARPVANEDFEVGEEILPACGAPVVADVDRIEEERRNK